MRRATIHADRETAVNGPGTIAYSVQWHSVDVFDLGRAVVVGSIPLPETIGSGSGAVALSPDDATITVVTASGITVAPVSGAVAVPPCMPADVPTSVAGVCGIGQGEVVTDAGHAYVTNPDHNRVEVLSLATGRLEAPIPVGSRPRGLDLSLDGTTLYVANTGGEEISVVDLARRVEVRRITVPSLGHNDRPSSIAVADNGRALLTTVFGGYGYGTFLVEVDLDQGTSRLRADFGPGSFGRLSTGTIVKASPDRSHIAVVGPNSGGEVTMYASEPDTFGPTLWLWDYLSAVALDESGTRALFNPGGFVTDGEPALEGAIPSGGKGVAMNRAGTTGYRVQDESVEVLDLHRRTVVRSIPLPEPVGTGRGSIALTPDGATLVVVTTSGMALVRTETATVGTAHSSWSQPTAEALDGLGSWMAIADGPVAKAGQLAPSYLYGHYFGFENTTASGVVALVVVPGGRSAVFSLVGADGVPRAVGVPFDWRAGRYYFSLVHQLVPGTWARVGVRLLGRQLELRRPAVPGGRSGPAQPDQHHRRHVVRPHRSGVLRLPAGRRPGLATDRVRRRGGHVRRLHRRRGQAGGLHRGGVLRRLGPLHPRSGQALTRQGCVRARIGRRHGTGGPRRASRKREERGGGRRRKGGGGRGTGSRDGQAGLAGRPVPGAIRTDGEAGLPHGGVHVRGRGPCAGRLRPDAPPLGQHRAPEGLPAHGRAQRLPLPPAAAGAGAVLQAQPDAAERQHPGRGRRAVRRPGRPALPPAGSPGAALLRGPAGGRHRRRPRMPAGHGEVAVAPGTGRAAQGGGAMNVDEQLRETLQRRAESVEPSPGGWAAINRRIDRRQRRAHTLRLSLVGGMSFAAVVLAVGDDHDRRPATRRPERGRHRWVRRRSGVHHPLPSTDRESPARRVVPIHRRGRGTPRADPDPTAPPSPPAPATRARRTTRSYTPEAVWPDTLAELERMQSSVDDGLESWPNDPRAVVAAYLADRNLPMRWAIPRPAWAMTSLRPLLVRLDGQRSGVSCRSCSTGRSITCPGPRATTISELHVVRQGDQLAVDVTARATGNLDVRTKQPGSDWNDGSHRTVCRRSAGVAHRRRPGGHSPDRPGPPRGPRRDNRRGRQLPGAGRRALRRQGPPRRVDRCGSAASAPSAST